MMSKFTVEQNKEFWNEFANKSKDNTFGASGGRHLVEIENQFIISQLKSNKFSSLLDIGCGNGQRTLLFSKYISGKTVGIDYSEKMIEEAKNLLSKQPDLIRNKLSFEIGDINKFSNQPSFDVIVSCRCFINQPSYDDQIALFKALHNMLKEGGSLIIAEISKQGMENLDEIRSKYSLSPMKPRWHNLHIDEEKVLSKINKLFYAKITRRGGLFYFLSRVLHPAVVYPDDPKPESQFNEIAMKSETLFQGELEEVQNNFEKFGGHLMIHYIKK